MKKSLVSLLLLALLVDTARAGTHGGLLAAAGIALFAFL